jgi:hypothetical protein
MRYRCNGCGTEFKFTNKLIHIECPFCVPVFVLTPIDTPPDRLDAIRKRAEALGVSEKTINILINGIFKWINEILDELENHRLDRKEATE